MKLDLHQGEVSVFVLFSVLSLVLFFSKQAAKEVEAMALNWIRAFKRIQAELHRPLKNENSSEPPHLIDPISSKSRPK